MTFVRRRLIGVACIGVGAVAAAVFALWGHLTLAAIAGLGGTAGGTWVATPASVAEEDRFSWRLPLYAAVGTVMVFLPLVISSADLGFLFYLFVAIPLVSVVLFTLAVRKKGRQRLSMLSMLVVYWAGSAVLVRNDTALRETARWSLWSRRYKADVLRQPDSASGELRHAEWDGWGFAGAGTTLVYLVFDPSESLAAQGRSHAAGRFSGIPCKVDRLRRLESHWYSVLFYTGTDWGHCN
jgi:hypothetical protein